MDRIKTSDLVHDSYDDFKRTIRVLYVHASPTLGGSSNSLRYLLQSFPSNVVQPILLCPPGSAFEAFSKSGFQIHAVKAFSHFLSPTSNPLKGFRLLVLLRTLWFLREDRFLRKAIAKWRPDIVHLNESVLLNAARIAKSTGVPVVMHARSVISRDPKWPLKITLAALNRYTDAVIAIDESVKNSIRECRHVYVVYNPLRLNYQHHSSVIVPASLGEKSLKSVKVTFLANLLKSKGVWDLLEAARLLRQRKDIHIQIAGGSVRFADFFLTPIGRLARSLRLTSDVQTEMEAYIRRHALQEHVSMLGYVEDIAQLFSNTDILVFPSHLNGPSRSVFEAGVYGIPSIVALKDKIEDIVVHNKTGLIVPEKNPAALAKAIVQLVDDQGLRKKLGDNARDKYKKQFDHETSARNVLRIYRSLIRSGMKP